jgi:cytochrome c oxidase subunit 2
MRYSRVLSWLLVGVCGAVFFTTPAAAQSVNRAAIDELNTQLLYVALPLTLFVELTLVYAIYRFHDNDNPKPTVDDPALEITWTAATGAILVFVGVSGFFVLASPYISPAAGGPIDSGDTADDMEIDVLAYQWGWEFSYPESNVTTQQRLVLPRDTDVRFSLRSTDVIHSIYIPALGVKQDIFPAQTTIARTKATQNGSYRLYCAELCGSGHTRMHATVVVMNQTNYDSWIAGKQGANGTATFASADGGAAAKSAG